MTTARRIVARVSDHALLRYLDRVKGLDLAAVRAEILTPTVCAAIAAGATAVIIQGHRCPVANGTITTVQPKANNRVSTNGRAHTARRMEAVK